MIRPRLLLAPLLLLSTAGCAARTGGPSARAPLPPDAIYEGPDHVTLDLLRTGEGAPKIFVQATYPDGSTGLFMVDTGAAVSALSRTTAERLGLDLKEGAGAVEGLGGRSTYAAGTIDELRLGEALLRDVDFAVGVRGVPEQAYFMPLDGILGNNVWSRFVLEVDYPADTLVLHRPGRRRVPGRASAMFFDGQHVYAPLSVVTDTEPPSTHEVVLQVDTGAGDLLLSGQAGRTFEGTWTEGVEPIYGIGASEYVPASSFLRRTRRIPVEEVGFGGRRFPVDDLEARWMNFGGGVASGPSGMQGLIGFEVMKDHRVWFDYQGGRFALTPSRRPARALDGHQVLLDQDLATHGEDAPERGLFRAKMRFALLQTDEAVAELERFLEAVPEGENVVEARVLLARARRFEADFEGARAALEPLAPGELVDEGEIVAAVNGQILDGGVDPALALATLAVAERPDEPEGYIALADARLARGDLHGARSALLDAARLQQNPDANLLRRARVALAEGDRHGALALVRRLLRLYPTGGSFLWFYSTLLTDEAEETTFRADLAAAVARQHPQLLPLDFLVAARHAVGDADRARELMEDGLDRDCARATEQHAIDNCTAWYHALAGYGLDEALERIEAALAETGDRSDYLDTRAMVLLARGDVQAAHDSAVAAARINPDDVYMLWQAERIGALLGEGVDWRTRRRAE